MFLSKIRLLCLKSSPTLLLDKKAFIRQHLIEFPLALLYIKSLPLWTYSTLSCVVIEVVFLLSTKNF